MNPCLTVVIRLAQLVFSTIVLALSVVLIQGQRSGDAPVITKFSAFLGGFGILMALFGVTSQIITLLRNSKITGAVDFIAGLFQFAGGIAMAAQLGPGVNSCSNKLFRETNDIINGGYVVVGGRNLVYKNTPFVSRCKMASSIAAFEFLAGMAFVVSGILMILASQKKKTATATDKW